MEMVFLKIAPYFVSGFVAISFILFLIFFIKPAITVNIGLKKIIKGIQALKSKVDHPSLVRPTDVNPLMRSEPYFHLWSEYSDTLHILKKTQTLTEVRATIPAEAYFTKEVIVESQLFGDFFKHLPGILTGLGIIATFAGLIMGLKDFAPSEEASQVRESLANLLRGVDHAFKYSALAISVAMIVTFLEKFSLAMCYKKVEKLCTTIDSLYNMGAGEEYLSRLVEATETSAVHTAQLKDALVEDLHKMMSNLTDRQIEAQRVQSEMLGSRIGQSINETFAPTMEKVMNVVERASGEQGTAVQSMLENLLAAFMAKLDSTFGVQMQNINDALQQSVKSISTVQGSLERLVGDIGNAGETAASKMSSKLEEAMQKAAEGQELMNEQIRGFVSEMRKNIEDQRNQSKTVMDEAVKTVLDKMGTAMQRLSDDRAATEKAEMQRHIGLQSQTQELYSGLSSEVTQLVQQIAVAATKSETNIKSLQDVSIRAISEMNDGAGKINIAATRFAESGNALNGIIDKSTILATQMQSTSKELQNASGAVRIAFEQYDKTRGTIERYVGELTAMIETAKRESGLNKELVADMEKMVAGIKGVEQQTTTYLSNVNDVLQKAFQEFGKSMITQVEKTIGQTDKHLAGSVSQINAIVQELMNQLARMRRTN